MSAFTNLTRRAVVRAAFSECATWREVLGPSEPLHPFVIDGPLDAPSWIPSGALGLAQTIQRTESA